MSDEADEAYSVTEQLTMTGINRIRQKINAHGIPVYLCEACGNPIPEARRKIFPLNVRRIRKDRENIMHKSVAEHSDLIPDEHEWIFRKQKSLYMRREMAR